MWRPSLSFSPNFYTVVRLRPSSHAPHLLLERKEKKLIVEVVMNVHEKFEEHDEKVKTFRETTTNKNVWPFQASRSWIYALDMA
ncbi:hypothetical protein M5689_013726 [Euphorbia peplus]|nr:hypothetical protein M5689_013726 [Euphorbia peplus]